MLIFELGQPGLHNETLAQTTTMTTTTATAKKALGMVASLFQATQVTQFSYESE